MFISRSKRETNIYYKSYPFAPIFPAKVSNAIQLLNIIIFVLQTTLSFPRQHPNVTPLIPEKLNSWTAEFRLGSFAACREKNTYICTRKINIYM